VFHMLGRITQSSDVHKTESVTRTDNGSEFQSVGPETAEHLWPYLVVLERGTARLKVTKPWLLLSHRASPRLNQYQIIPLGNRVTEV